MSWHGECMLLILKNTMKMVVRPSGTQFTEPHKHNLRRRKFRTCKKISMNFDVQNIWDITFFEIKLLGETDSANKVVFSMGSITYWDSISDFTWCCLITLLITYICKLSASVRYILGQSSTDTGADSISTDANCLSK